MGIRRGPAPAAAAAPAGGEAARAGRGKKRRVGARGRGTPRGGAVGYADGGGGVRGDDGERGRGHVRARRPPPRRTEADATGQPACAARDLRLRRAPPRAPCPGVSAPKAFLFLSALQRTTIRFLIVILGNFDLKIVNHNGVVVRLGLKIRVSFEKGTTFPPLDHGLPLFPWFRGIRLIPHPRHKNGVAAQ